MVLSQGRSFMVGIHTGHGATYMERIEFRATYIIAIYEYPKRRRALLALHRPGTSPNWAPGWKRRRALRPSGRASTGYHLANGLGSNVFALVLGMSGSCHH